MGLCEEQKTGKAMQAKFVEALLHNRQPAGAHCPGEQGIQLFTVKQYFPVAMGEVADVVLSKLQSRVHSHLQDGFLPRLPIIKNAASRPALDRAAEGTGSLRSAHPFIPCRGRMSISGAGAISWNTAFNE